MQIPNQISKLKVGETKVIAMDLASVLHNKFLKGEGSKEICEYAYQYLKPDIGFHNANVAINKLRPLFHSEDKKAPAPSVQDIEKVIKSFN
jgi:hypothetical protein